MKKYSFTLLLAALAALVLAACSTPAAAIDINNLPAVVDAQTVSTIKDDPGVFVIDVREQWEYDEGHIPGVTLIPLAELPTRLDEIPTDQQVIVTCRSGNRSGQAVDFLQAQGFTNVHNMDGGIVAWEAAGLPVEH